jgi:hypothetical protein
LATQLRTFEVKKCPRCGEQHRFALKVKETSQGTAIFGGGGAEEIAFICPNTKQPFTQLIEPEPGTEIIGPIDPSQLVAVDSGAPRSGSDADTPAADEFLDWQRSSRSIAIDFCKTMLTVATGAIPIYFAMLKYLGVEQASSSWWPRSAVVPPVLFLASTVVFVLALRPGYAIVRESEFAAYRRHRLERMNAFILGATLLFLLAVAIATVIFFALLSGSR